MSPRNLSTLVTGKRKHVVGFEKALGAVKVIRDQIQYRSHSFLNLARDYLGPVHMIPGQLIAPGQLTDPGVNFASVHGLTPVTVHMSFSLPRGNFERRVTRCTTPGNPPCRGNFSPCEQNAKVAPGQE